MRNGELQYELRRQDDAKQERHPPIASPSPQPGKSNPERDRADDLGLPEDGRDRRGEIEPRRVRKLHEVQDRTIEARERAERHQHREDDERRERRGAARQRVDALTGALSLRFFDDSRGPASHEQMGPIMSPSHATRPKR